MVNGLRGEAICLSQSEGIYGWHVDADIDLQCNRDIWED